MSLPKAGLPDIKSCENDMVTPAPGVINPNNMTANFSMKYELNFVKNKPLAATKFCLTWFI